MGYRINGGIWNYIHGNHNALSFINDKIKPLSAYSVILNKYIPQINFTDVKSFDVILVILLINQLIFMYFMKLIIKKK